MINRGEEHCQGFAGETLDALIADLVLAALQPGAVDVALQLAEDVEIERAREHRQLELRLEQARYETERAQRQYDEVEPENRLVARTLERRCEAITQAPASLPIERGLFGPGLLAHLLVSKFDDHLPLYRQAEIFARSGMELSRSTLADQVGHAVRLLRPLIQAIETSVTGSAKLHADDTPVPVLNPGAGRTKTGYLWVYLRDDCPWNGPSPPAGLYRYSPGRGGEHPCDHLKDFRGALQADGYAGFNGLYEPGPDGRVRIIEVTCMAHGRRKFHDVAVSAKGKAPIAAEALRRIGELYGRDRTCWPRCCSRSSANISR